MKRGILINTIIILILLFLALLPFIVAFLAEQAAVLNGCEMGPFGWGEGICRTMYTLTVLSSIFFTVITPLFLAVLAAYLLGLGLLFFVNLINSRRTGQPMSRVILGMVTSATAFVVLMGGSVGAIAGINWYQVSYVSACESLPGPLGLTGVNNGPLALGVMLPYPAGRPEQYAILIASPEGEILARLNDLPGASDPAWSPDGKQLVFAAQSEAQGGWGLYLADAQGQVSAPVLGDRLRMSNPVWGRDGRSLLFVRWVADGPRPDSEIFAYHLDEVAPRRLPGSTAFDGDARLSPDGSQIVFTSQRDRQNDIYLMNTDGSNLRRLTRGSASDVDPYWAPDGQWIIFASDRGSPTGRTNYNLYSMSTDGSNQCRLTQGPGSYRKPAWSPDGEWIAYISLLETQAYLIRPDGTQETPLRLDEELFNLLSLDWARQP